MEVKASFDEKSSFKMLPACKVGLAPRRIPKNPEESREIPRNPEITAKVQDIVMCLNLTFEMKNMYK